MCINRSRHGHSASSVGRERQRNLRAFVILVFDQYVTEHLAGNAQRFAGKGEERLRVHKSSFFLRVAPHAIAVSAHFVHECRNAFHGSVLGNSVPEIEDVAVELDLDQRLLIKIVLGLGPLFTGVFC